LFLGAFFMERVRDMKDLDEGRPEVLIGMLLCALSGFVVGILVAWGVWG
jgi:hypothetical protein